jgi:hypothetical protein
MSNITINNSISNFLMYLKQIAYEFTITNKLKYLVNNAYKLISITYQ